jgi:hypothetical protein
MGAFDRNQTMFGEVSYFPFFYFFLEQARTNKQTVAYGGNKSK